MKRKIQNKIAGLGNTIRHAVTAEKGLWQQPESIGLQPAFALTQNQLSFSQSKFFAKGIPFSPLND